MYQAVVLAAGYSSRAKTNKLRLTVLNVSILRRIVMTLLQVCSEVIVVSGHHHEEVLGLVEDMACVRVVYNERYDLGMFSSVKTGIEFVTDDVFIMPGDCPMVQSVTCEQMKAVASDIVVPTFSGRKGHPILIRKKLLDTLKKEPEASNLKAFRDRHDVAYIEVKDESILWDVDTIDDYHTLIERVEGGSGIENSQLRKTRNN